MAWGWPWARRVALAPDLAASVVQMLDNHDSNRRPVFRWLVYSSDYLRSEENDRLSIAVVARPVRHSDELTARPGGRIGPETHRIPHEPLQLIFGLAVDDKPAVKRFTAAV